MTKCCCKNYVKLNKHKSDYCFVYKYQLKFAKICEKDGERKRRRNKRHKGRKKEEKASKEREMTKADRTI